MCPNADFVTFTEEILNGKLLFLWSEWKMIPEGSVDLETASSSNSSWGVNRTALSAMSFGVWVHV